MANLCPHRMTLARAKVKKRCGKVRLRAASQEGVMKHTPENVGIMESIFPRRQILPCRGCQWPELLMGAFYETVTAIIQNLVMAGSGEGPVGIPQPAFGAGTVESDRSKVSPTKWMISSFVHRRTSHPCLPEIHTLVKEIRGWENPPVRRYKGQPGRSHLR